MKARKLILALTTLALFVLSAGAAQAHPLW